MIEEAELVMLLGRVACGDQNAFSRLYETMSPRIYGLCMRLLGRRDLAEDVLQDAFVRIWHHAGEYHAERGTPAGWMLTVARYRALDVLRRRRFELSLDHDSLTELADARLQATDAETDDTTFLALQGCLEEISPQQRDSILQAFYHGQTHEQLATRMQAPLGTVKSWVRRGLSSLKRCLEQ
ncbi:MAG: sigma-70 family RNA polymerase sigma factor [Pseudomonadota bacterium]|jgi:RNA polymerase sigma factor (sigma-70 family)